MKPIGVYRRPTAEMILEVCRYLKDAGFVVDRPGRGNQLLMPPDAPIYIRNDADAEIPAFGCVQTTGAVDYKGQNYITVDRPVDNDGTAGKYLFNSRAPIEVGGYGIAYAGPLVRVLTDGSPVVCGDQWQPVVNSFLLSLGGAMITAVGADDIETDCMRAFVNGAGDSSQGWIKGNLLSLRVASSAIPEEAPYTGLVIGTITVETTSCNLTSLIDEEIDVVDWMGCVFDLAIGDLLGVWVIAKKEIGKSQDPAADPGELTPCHFSADDRCCVPADSGA